MRPGCGVPIAVLLLTGWTGQAGSPLEEYRKLEFPSKDGDFEKGWKDRVAIEFKIINSGNPELLRAALKDSNRHVRSMAATALGVQGDKPSAEAIAELARNDREPWVRSWAIQALGWLKTGTETIQAAKTDAEKVVRFQAELAEGRLKDSVDYGAKVREAYKVGIEREVMGSAEVGKAAPDFTLVDSEGQAFRLSDVVEDKVVILDFLIADF